MTNKHLVFTYGTLKRGYGNNRLLRSSTFIGEAITIPDCYTMYDGGYPYVLKEGISHVKGELWEVDDETLQSLDWLEGVPSHYIRHETQVRTIEEGETYETLMYVASSETTKYLKKTRVPIIPDDENILTWSRKVTYHG